MLAAASRLLAECNASPLCDFDDLLYRAVARAIPLPRYDLVLVDEAQDCCPIQIAILRKILNKGGRVVAVGDTAQAIYGFRGAMSDSMDKLAEAFDAAPLPLSITYRCAADIVALAAEFAPIEPAPNAPKGKVSAPDSWALSSLCPADMVICRTNAPLLKLAYALVRARKPVLVMGREIGAGLVSLINKLQPKGIDGLLEKLGAWQDRETLKLQARDAGEAQIATVADKADSIRVVIDGLPENERTVPALCRAIEGLFSGGPEGKVILASIHKSKGLEAERVYILNWSAMPSRWAKQEWQKQGERNLQYVAITRAKSELFLVEADDMTS
jgi:superfamily I DNA/RNA helicase